MSEGIGAAAQRDYPFVCTTEQYLALCDALEEFGQLVEIFDQGSYGALSVSMDPLEAGWESYSQEEIPEEVSPPPFLSKPAVAKPTDEELAFPHPIIDQPITSSK